MEPLLGRLNRKTQGLVPRNFLGLEGYLTCLEIRARRDVKRKSHPRERGKERTLGVQVWGQESKKAVVRFKLTVVRVNVPNPRSIQPKLTPSTTSAYIQEDSHPSSSSRTEPLNLTAMTSTDHVFT